MNRYSLGSIRAGSVHLNNRALRHTGYPTGAQYEASSLVTIPVETDPGPWTNLDSLVEDRASNLGTFADRDTVKEYAVLHLRPGRDPTVEPDD